MSEDVDLIKKHLGDAAVLYDYRDWLDEQAGARISQLAESIYVTMPCIILAARDWFFRPATLLEQQLLTLNLQPKLVFDYSDEFRRRESVMGISCFTYGRFIDDRLPDLNQVTDFVRSCFPSR
ncbi:MAG: hypothetical protein EOO15_02760 [Chitinophagaceae bacterium]|nr:MAG: hypothetical protein EOO15_02760 [Chitinophagaceae bacterium]